ncbi:murein transglycosylase A [Candidatus Finniella inopinata]|uniref:peptidoglycan lytic exotransglycosylase n=1 Tax=Candidatus Finniella inopinata TaxID=1696036 RepID=A0A4Q7DHW6_9PROT|nr:MltA domain-containing protein [Candidatus Finniella inopinata]RZI46541.1 murein transglycosylase [Candidatus Finniella inopinata]
MLIPFDDLPGWRQDTFLSLGRALLYSAPVVLDDPVLKEWHPFYQAVVQHNGANWRYLIQQYLRAYRLEAPMHFTGYYEPLLRGSLQQWGVYQTPLYALTNDCTLPRSAIVKGALAGQGLELVWVDDPIAAFFLQIQGSGRIQLDDGTVLRLGYAGTNRHPYHPIGKTLITQKSLDLENVTMQTISQWLKDNPVQAEDVMSTNKSYVFFKVLAEGGPIGTQGVPLTPGRSLAVDQKHMALGTLVWVDIPHPLQKDVNLQHLMIAQDTGGAIKGPARGDYFWGFGENAEQSAGVMNVKGDCYRLLPI